MELAVLFSKHVYWTRPFVATTLVFLCILSRKAWYSEVLVQHCQKGVVFFIRLDWRYSFIHAKEVLFNCI